MKLIKKIVLLALSVSIISCNNDDDLSVNDQINSFIYNAMDVYYLYKDDQPLFNQSFFSINEGSPEAFFEKLTVAEDRFSFIFYDYEILEAYFAGESTSSGISYNLHQKNGVYYAAVTKVAVEGDAFNQGVKRGDFITAVDGAPLTENNQYSLSSSISYTLELSNYDSTTDTFTPFNEVTVSEAVLSENPIVEYTIIEEEGTKIGYIMYDRFLRGSQIALNEVFGILQSEGVDELVLDLRYNGGGSVATAIALSSICLLYTSPSPRDA